MQNTPLSILVWLIDVELQSPEVPKSLMRKLMFSAGCWIWTARAGEVSPCAPCTSWLLSLHVHPKHCRAGVVLSVYVHGSVNKEKMWHYILKATSAKNREDSPISGVPQEREMTQHILFTVCTPLSEGIPLYWSPPEQRCPDCFFLLPSWLSVLPHSSVCFCIATETVFQHFLAPAFAIIPSEPLLLNSLCSGLVLPGALGESVSHPPFLHSSWTH